ncbi:MAG: OpgC domain-containing protein [Planctomycetaceae bacterium]|nr:OpgC domain-containing protein [Planctomycetaceae bacterium]
MPEPATSRDSRRDERIDFLRGLALIVITLDHIYGNWLTMVMPISLGLSDMAEVFVFLSGIVGGWSFARRSTRDGPWSATLHFWGRAIQLYLVYVVAGFLVLLLIRWTGTSQQLTLHRDTAILLPLDELLLRVAMLRQHVGHLSILPLYCCCLSCVPLWMWLRRRTQSVVPPTLLALALYLTAQWSVTSLPLPALVEAAIYYRPVPWMSLFLLGMVCGQLTPQRFAHPAWWGIALVIQATMLCWKLMDAPALALLLGKPNLGLGRMLHFLSLALLVSRLLPRQSHWYLSFIRGCGRRSLRTYLAGALAAVLISSLFTRGETSSLVQILGNGLAIAICLIVGNCSGVPASSESSSDVA